MSCIRTTYKLRKDCKMSATRRLIALMCVCVWGLVLLGACSKKNGEETPVSVTPRATMSPTGIPQATMSSPIRVLGLSQEEADFWNKGAGIPIPSLIENSITIEGNFTITNQTGQSLLIDQRGLATFFECPDVAVVAAPKNDANPEEKFIYGENALELNTRLIQVCLEYELYDLKEAGMTPPTKEEVELYARALVYALARKPYNEYKDSLDLNLLSKYNTMSEADYYGLPYSIPELQLVFLLREVSPIPILQPGGPQT